MNELERELDREKQREIERHRQREIEHHVRYMVHTYQEAQQLWASGDLYHASFMYLECTNPHFPPQPIPEWLQKIGG
jgi:hypothetical protein